jgi:hypothetical protein
MKTFIRLHNTKTGSWEDIDFPNMDAAFEKYWELTDDPPKDIEFELITTTADELLGDGERP